MMSNRMKRMAEENAYVGKQQDLTINGQVDFSGDKEKLSLTPCYIMDSDSFFGQFYEMSVIIGTTYTIFATPLVFVFPQIYETTRFLELAVDFIFLGDVITNLFTSTDATHVTLKVII